MRRYYSSRYGGVVLTAVGLIPGAPLLVPELSGTGSADAEAVRAAVLRAGHRLATGTERWTVVGAGNPATSVRSSGTFRGFGADVVVSLTASPDGRPDVRMPLPLLIGAWLRTRVAPAIDAAPKLISPDTSAESASRQGIALFEELEASTLREGILVVADGSTMLTARAPGSFNADAPDFQRELDVAIESGDWHKIAALDPDQCVALGAGEGRAPLQLMSAVVEKMHPRVDSGEYFAPFGVGYHVRTWSR